MGPETARVLVRWCIIGLTVWAGTVLILSLCCEPTGVFFCAMLGAPVGLAMFAVGIYAARRANCHRGRCTAVITVSLAIVPSIVFWEWPMRLTFAVSSSALSRLADQVAAGKPPSLPAKAGLFTVRSVEVRGPSICLWTDASPAGPSGFVRHPPGVTPRVNVWSDTCLTARWRYMEED